MLAVRIVRSFLHRCDVAKVASQSAISSKRTIVTSRAFKTNKLGKTTSQKFGFNTLWTFREKITKDFQRKFFSTPQLMALQKSSFQYDIEENLSDDAILKNFTTGRSSFDSATLVKENPDGKPTFPLKKIVYDLAIKGRDFSGTLQVSRYKLFPCEKAFPTHKFELDLRQDVFDYIRTDNVDSTIEWHVNFADPYLFTAFSSPLFAQDEIQVAEMPVLGHLRRLLDKATHSPENNLLPYTRKNGRGTPILIRGIQRFCSVETNANASEGRPYGLYGNAFSRHKPDVIEKATKIIDPPQIVNMLAMSALPGGHGEYSKDEIIDTFTTAYTTFRAAKLESHLQVNAEELGGAVVPKVVIHTGNWGTGAFGGSKPLMAAIQLAAAHMAKVDRVVFHSFNKEGTDGFKEGERVYRELLEGKNPTFEEFVAGLKSQRYRWGFSDGN